MAEHVCSTECGCGHWKPRISRGKATIGRINLDVIESSVGDENPSIDYGLLEDVTSPLDS